MEAGSVRAPKAESLAKVGLAEEEEVAKALAKAVGKREAGWMEGDLAAALEVARVVVREEVGWGLEAEVVTAREDPAMAVVTMVAEAKEVSWAVVTAEERAVAGLVLEEEGAGSGDGGGEDGGGGDGGGGGGRWWRRWRRRRRRRRWGRRRGRRRRWCGRR